MGVAALVGLLVGVLAASGSPGQPASPLVGKAAPAITGRSLFENSQVDLSQFAGHWVLVNFMASWCVPCRQEMPALSAISRSGTVVLTVAYDESDVANLARFLRAQGARWPAVDDGSAVVNYGVTGIPESYLVSPASVVVAKYTGDVSASSVERLIGRLGA
jgi:cytochrome c biogenesis protein CcmG/thiol:disulfide interchange protein DsbE